MFERFLTDYVTQNFGHLIEDFDQDQLRISAWNGKIVLEDVFLRPDALDSLMEQCPLELAFGKIGRLELSVPWSLVGSQLWRRKNTVSSNTSRDMQAENSVVAQQSIRVILSNVNILITPRRKRQTTFHEAGDEANDNKHHDVSDNNLDEAFRQRKQQEQKEKAVQELLDAQLLSRVANSSRLGSRWQWLQDSLYELLSNLSVTAENLHVRYEDPGHCMGFFWKSAGSTRGGIRRYRKAFAVGLTLGDFSVKTAIQKQSKEVNKIMKDVVESSSLAPSRCSSPESVLTENSMAKTADDAEPNDQSKIYRRRCKIAAAEKVAIYWDSGGCPLISENSSVAGDNHSKGDYLSERTQVEILFDELNAVDRNSSNATYSVSLWQPHTYLMNPVSPSVEVALVSQTLPISRDGDDTGEIGVAIPPSSVKITLPATSFAFSRQTLEDFVYIRKSLDIWMQSNKGVLSNKSLKRLVKLRPKTTAKCDPQAWWKYAIEATIAFIQIGRAQEAIHGESKDSNDVQSVNKQAPRGWPALARALGRRKRYLALYTELFAPMEMDTKNEPICGPHLPRVERQLRAHSALLELERQLTASEICAFRIAAYFAITGNVSKGFQLSSKATVSTKTFEIGWVDVEQIVKQTITASSAAGLPSSKSIPERLSLRHRCSMFLEMGQALEREKINEEIRREQEQEQESIWVMNRHPTVAVAAADSSLWEIALSCRELSLQMNDRQSTTFQRARGFQGTGIVPVVRIACACLSEGNMKTNGSWQVECTIAGLRAEDLALEIQGMSQANLHRWRTLLGPKADIGASEEVDEMLEVDGITFRQSVYLSVRRELSLQPSTASTDVVRLARQGESVTRTNIRLFPMEIVYSTVPFEALTRLLSTVKTPELAEDYHRMASRVYQWRERQKKRFLQALAHRDKKIFIDLDVTAPVLIVPEVFDRYESPMLVLDLGRLNFFNFAKDKTTAADFDDAWRLLISDIQVQCSTTANEKAHKQDPHQLIEPFSLNILILSQIGEDGNEAKVNVTATLPRLSFNLTSSSVRLVGRLRKRWADRKKEVERVGIGGTESQAKADYAIVQEASSLHGKVDKNPTSESPSQNGHRVFEFEFSAPLITVDLKNDVDARAPTSVEPATHIVSLAVNGIGGRLLNKMSKNGASTTSFGARLQSLVALDHYQTAGKDYCLLLSSLEPGLVLPVIGAERMHDWKLLFVENSSVFSDGKDLVLIDFCASHGVISIEDAASDKLSVMFHELYVEWNPETVAAIQKAARIPLSCTTATCLEGVQTSNILPDNEEDSDEFFDAHEDVFFDTLASNSEHVDPDLNLPLLKLSRTSRTSLLFSRGVALPFEAIEAADVDTEIEIRQPRASSMKVFEIEFNLSKLRVNFNKEARHRRLFSTEMDRAHIHYTTRPYGGSKTTSRLGNLIVSDPSAATSDTLYSQIVGLQTGTNSNSLGTSSSLLEMQIVTNTKTRTAARSTLHEEQATFPSSVSLCYEEGKISGCDTYIRARFSPMRFVYLQQLWSEIVDYFFEGIMGYEVLGKARPVPEALKACTWELNDVAADDDSDPNQLSFTKFNFSIDSPEVLLPVTYRSPQFLKLCASHIYVSNSFDCRVNLIRCDVSRWHNNCNVHFEGLRVLSWDGKDISHSRTSVAANIEVRWPMGPLAPAEVPAWDVCCNLQSLEFFLRPEDYALFQNIVAFNVGEESRHLDEWAALQNLSATQLDKYRESVMVHFGYDKKDVTPSTYQIKLEMPLLTVNLESDNCYVGVASCSKFKWEMVKLRDRISCQTITCYINLKQSRANNETLTLISLNRTLGQADLQAELKYTSTSKTSADNVKTLDISNASIYLVYPAWMALMGFFSGLPEVEILSTYQVSNAIQIGDRWYPISSSTDAIHMKAVEKRASVGSRFSWIGSHNSKKHADDRNVALQQPSSQMKVSLKSPSIILSGGNDKNASSIVLRSSHLDFLLSRSCLGETTKSFFVHELELYTSVHVLAARSSDSTESSLIQPWSLSGVQQSCSNITCNCDSHSIKLVADVVRARAAYSDMMIVIEVSLSLLAEIRLGRNEEKRLETNLENLGIDEGASSQGILKEISTPAQHIFALEWSGFELLVVDDSGRHFKGSQELITLVLGNILFLRQERNMKVEPCDGQTEKNVAHKMMCHLRCIDLLDCLQPDESPFRQLVSSQTASLSAADRVRKMMDWEGFAMQKAHDWGFSASPAFKERLDASFTALIAMSVQRLKSGTAAISLSSCADGGDIKRFEIRLRACAIQYNPSTVIALQRFLGRFKKQAVKSLEEFNEEINKLKASYESQTRDVIENAVSSQVNERIIIDVDLESLSVSLNKEHQRRRLLRVDLLGCRTTLSSDNTGIEIQGSVQSLNAWDCDNFNQQSLGVTIQTPNTNVLRVKRADASKSALRENPFLKFGYSTFKGDGLIHRDRQIPFWVRSQIEDHIIGGHDIDDCLEVSLCTIEFTHLRGRTEEILDYLSNGLPGKGMGATSKAATGFLKKRIQTKSFLHLKVENPTIFLPANELATRGMRLNLGDIVLTSWFEGGSMSGRIAEIDLSTGVEMIRVPIVNRDNPSEEEEWWRMLSLKINNFSMGVVDRNATSTEDKDLLNQPINCYLVLQKPAWRGSLMSLRCKVSLVNMTLRYTQYCLIHSVMKGNLGRKIDKEKWDNIEAAYDLELQQSEVEANHTVRVQYAAGARHIRFGVKTAKQIEPRVSTGTSAEHKEFDGKSVTTSGFDLNFTFDGFALKLRRDDLVEGVGAEVSTEAFEYDMILLSVQLMKISISNRNSGDPSLQLSLFRIGLFDLGDLGRRQRENLFLQAQSKKGQRKLSRIRAPCAFTVLVEGYSLFDEDDFLLHETEVDTHDEPQLVLTVEKVPAATAVHIGSLDNPIKQRIDSGTVTVAKLVLNLLSVNCILRPFREVGAFFALSWPTRSDIVSNLTTKSNSVTENAEQSPGKKGEKNMQIKLVAHHPRVFFVSDETYANSRALVLKGLAVVHIGLRTRTIKVDAVELTRQAFEDAQSDVVVDAQLHSLESYINPGVDKALRLQKRHAGMLSTEAHSRLYAAAIAAEDIDQTELATGTIGETLGVALLQPVTAGFEYGKSSRSRFPSERFLSVNIEPISTMLSFDDLQLIDSIAQRMTAERSSVLAGSGSSKGGSFIARDELEESDETKRIRSSFEADTKEKGLEDEKEMSSSVYTLYFRRGVPNGLLLEKSVIGDMPVVTQVDPCIAAALHSDMIYPRPGAVLTQVHGTDSMELGFDETLALISKQCSSCESSQSEADSGPDLDGRHYSLAFAEKDSSSWGNHDSFDFSLQGAVLTFIDDLNGRDMPLFRGALNTVEAHVERGMGIQTYAMPRMTKFSCLSQDSSVQSSERSSSDSSLTVSTVVQTSLDYFHPRKAVYEPLMEPAQLCFLYETHTSTSPTVQDRVAIEVSDRLLRNTAAEAFHRKDKNSHPRFLSFNFSDASAEVVSNAMYEWKAWRRNLRRTTGLSVASGVSSPYLLLNTGSSQAEGPPPVSASIINAETQNLLYLESNTDNPAASNAAHAAYLFAQKRGAERSGRSDSSKPFVLRNRTGVSIAFVKQLQTASTNAQQMKRLMSKSSLLVGEYRGLDRYNEEDVTELADDEDAEFQMETVGSIMENFQGKSKRVRTYEGHFPRLTVAIQSVAGLAVDPVKDLQVQRAGSLIRHVFVHKSGADDTNSVDTLRYYIPVVWQVEVVDNRRILTLSSAVRIVSLSSAIGIEIGARKTDDVARSTCNEVDVVLREDVSDAGNGFSLEIVDGGAATPQNRARKEYKDSSRYPEPQSGIHSIGIARHESPIYLPLWLAIKVEPIEVFLRPKRKGKAEYAWSEHSVLAFAPSNTSTEGSSGAEQWRWQETYSEAVGSIRCNALSKNTSGAFLSCYTANRISVDTEHIQEEGNSTSLTHGQYHLADEAFSVFVDPGLSIRNLLPIDIEWQVAHGLPTASPELVDSSAFREDNDDGPTAPETLKTGECAEVFASNFKVESLVTRFRLQKTDCWSNWTLISSPAAAAVSGDRGFSSPTTNVVTLDAPSLFQAANVQIQDEFGTPVTLGVRVAPKMAKDHRRNANAVFGIDLIVYAELWISNLTTLPLVFGCPAAQVVRSKSDDANTVDLAEEAATQFSAEAALNEIVSVLELGETASKLDTRSTTTQRQAGDVLILPRQACRLLVEEIFEFLELEIDGSGSIKRHWWAAENHWNIKESNILQVSDKGKCWRWLDETWNIDCAGQASISCGGWESCKDLLAFSSNRQFDPTHPFRRRRWFRKRSSLDVSSLEGASYRTGQGFLPGLQVFHHPIDDTFEALKRKRKKKKRNQRQRGRLQEAHAKNLEADKSANFQLSIKCGDSRWSSPIIITPHGTQHGAVEVLASRWPLLRGFSNERGISLALLSPRASLATDDELPVAFSSAQMEPTLHDLVYHVKEVDGEFGEMSRLMMVAARFSVRNDSKSKTIEVKQAGTKDVLSVRLEPGKTAPFYWSDRFLPQLVCVRPADTLKDRKVYKWSGGFDVGTLGMTALCIRPDYTPGETDEEILRRIVFRSLVELRPGTGGLGMNISFQDEKEDGDGALFRIENESLFNIWIAQEGVLKNPSLLQPHPRELDGDLVRTGDKVAFGLDMPYRQGKYSHREAATMSELLYVRLALAPLSTRAGIETVKVVGLSVIGDSVRLKPSKLTVVLGTADAKALERVRVLAVISADGPSHVLKLRMMANPEIDTSFLESVTYGQSPMGNGSNNYSLRDVHQLELLEAISKARDMLMAGALLSEEETKRKALFGEPNPDAKQPVELAAATAKDRQLSLRLSLHGVVLSLVDASPSEICTITVNTINALVKWSQLRNTDASFFMSIGWLQVDNHVPNAPFPVAICPEFNVLQDQQNKDAISGDPAMPGVDSETETMRPFLFVGIEIAPKHSSGIVCLKSVTVALQNMAVSVDLAFLVRLQRYALDAKAHFQAHNSDGIGANAIDSQLQLKSFNKLPDISKIIATENALSQIGVGAAQVCIGAMAVLPYTIKLSVNPAQALTPAQAAFEGFEAAAIHKAVRKGDLSLGRNTYPLGVVIGRKNKTALAVVQGVFKSIVVDALLRMNGASLNLSGAFLRNQIFNGPQLATYFGAHYLVSLRQNVPALLGSLAAIGNPLGLFRGLGDGVSDFVTEPVKGLQKSIQNLNPQYVVDGVARGTGSLARHTVGGFADSAALLTSTFSKNMAVLTLDRRYAQKRDRSNTMREQQGDFHLMDGVESGFVKLAEGFIEGVTGVVRAPMRGAERRGVEGFFKGLGKGLLGLLVKPMIGISDAASDVFMAIKASVEGEGQQAIDRRRVQIRPRRALYGRDKQMRTYNLADAAACALMLRTCIGGQNFLSHLEMDDRVALLSDKRMLLLDSEGKELLLVKFSHISTVEVREYEANSCSVIIMLKRPRANGSDMEVVTCSTVAQAVELSEQIKHGMSLVEEDV